jgi:hypothetical protein
MQGRGLQRLGQEKAAQLIVSRPLQHETDMPDGPHDRTRPMLQRLSCQGGALQILTLIKFNVVELSSITDWLSAKPELSTDLTRVMSV